MTEKKVFKYKLCGKHAFIFCYDAPGRAAGPIICRAALPAAHSPDAHDTRFPRRPRRAFSLGWMIFTALRKQRTRNCSLLVAAGRAKKKIAIFNAVCAPNGQKNSGFVTPSWIKLEILSLESLVCVTLRKNLVRCFRRGRSPRRERNFFCPARIHPGRACPPQSSRYSRTRISPIFHRSHRFKGTEDKIFSSLTFYFEPQE